MGNQLRHGYVKQLEDKGLLTSKHVFLVKNIEKHPDAQYWVPMQGDSMTGFLSGSHEWKYIGVKGTKKVVELLKKVDKAQKDIVGVKRVNIEPAMDDVDVNLEELGLQLQKKKQPEKEEVTAS